MSNFAALILQNCGTYLLESQPARRPSNPQPPDTMHVAAGIATGLRGSRGREQLQGLDQISKHQKILCSPWHHLDSLMAHLHAGKLQNLSQ